MIGLCVWTNHPSPNARSTAFATRSTAVLCGLFCGSFTSNNPSSSSIGSSSSRKPWSINRPYSWRLPRRRLKRRGLRPLLAPLRSRSAAPAPARRRRHEEVVQKNGPRRHVGVVARAEERVAHHRAIQLGDQRREGGLGTEAVGENPLGRERPAVDPDVVVEVVGHFRQDRGLGGGGSAYPDAAHCGTIRGRPAQGHPWGPSS